MAIPSLLGSYIDETYQRIVQTTGSGAEFADGLGNPITFGTTPTGSLLTTASAAGNTITFTKGDGSTFPVTVTGGGTPGGPDTSIQFNDNGAFSGSTNLTFDKLSNALTHTGSFNVSGSTLQVGNNTLLGNTLLSGSIIISGSHLANTPTIKVYGDMETDGVIKFLPVNYDIDNTISGSYIFVSGSTDDLYFSQNGAGFSNVTRLRWLEGNLYTGLLNGGIITATIGSTTYQVSSGSGIIVSLNADYSRNPYPTIKYINWANLTSNIAPLSASFDQQFVAINSSSAIEAQGTPYNDGDYNTKIPIGIVIHQNRSTINAVQTFPSVGYGWKQRSYDFIKAFGPLKISGYTLSQSGSSARGLLLAGGTAWVDGRNYIVDPNNPSYISEAVGISTSKIYRYRQSGSGWAYDTNGGVGYTAIDPTQYSNGGVLTPVATNDWSLQRVFYFPNSATKAFYIYYGNATYASKTDAIAGIITETFNEAPNTAANAIFVGYMILRHNADFNTAASYEFRAAGLFRASGQGGGGGGGTTSPGGSNTQIQYNNNGAFGGVTNLTWDGTTLTATGSFTGSFTGNLIGTASYATTASYALNGGVTQLLAGSNITLSPTNGLGQVTVSSTGGGGIGGNTATGSYGSFYDTTIQNITTVGAVYSMSLDTTAISNGVAVSGSTTPFNTYIKMQNAGVYDIQFSAQIDKTTGTNAIVYIWLRKNGIDLAETNTAVTLAGGANDKALAAWNWFVNAAAEDYFQIVWASTNNNVRLFSSGPGAIDSSPAIPSLIVTANRIDQFLSNTGSFSGSFDGFHTGTFSGSFTGSLQGTASFATSASQAVTASYVLQAVSSSFAITASYVTNVAKSVGIVLDGGGNVITTGLKSDLIMPYAMQINSWTIVGDQTGSLVVDVWRSTAVTFPPTSSNTIIGAGIYPNITGSSAISQSSTLAGWTSTTLNSGDIVRFNVASASLVTKATLSLIGTQI